MPSEQAHGEPPAAGRGRLVPAERRRLLLELLRRERSVSVATIEERFGVSTMTARRDLALLAEAGQATRTHGGALLHGLASHEDSFSSRLAQHPDDKSRLARAVLPILEPDETIFVDSSSSAYCVVREALTAGIHLTLLTNSVAVMDLVAGSDAPNLELIGLGGAFRPLTHSFVGAQTNRAIGNFFADRLLFSVKGIERQGFLTDPDPLEAEVKGAMMTRARSVVLIAGGEKFDAPGLNVIGSATDVDLAFVTDPPPEGVKALEDLGVEVHRV